MRVKCLTSVSPLIAMHSSSSSSSSISDENAAEARESGLSAYSGNNRKTNYAQQQRKPALTDSREVFLLGKCIIKKHLHSQCNTHFHFDAAIHCSTPHNYVIYLTLRSLDFGSQPFISRQPYVHIFILPVVRPATIVFSPFHSPCPIKRPNERANVWNYEFLLFLRVFNNVFASENGCT